MNRWGAIIAVAALSLTGCRPQTTNTGPATNPGNHYTQSTEPGGTPGKRTETGGETVADTFAPAKPYETPQAAFDASINAQMKGDHETFVRCLDPQSQRELAGQMAVTIKDKYSTFAHNGERSAPERKHLRPLLEACARHGLTEAEVDKLQWDESPERVQNMQRSLLALVKDPPQFLVEYMTTQDKIQKVDYSKAKGMKAPTLTDLKVEGDKGKGTVVTNAFGREKKDPIEFTRVGGGWRVHLVPHSGV